MSIYVKRNLKDFISMRCLNSLCVCDKCAIHALIDVVTEQQKEIDELKESKEQPYTAMRSTGEVVEAIKRHNGYCECETSETADSNLYLHYLKNVKQQECTGLFHSTPCPECDKQPEDIREKIYYLFKSFGPCVTDNCPTCYDYADKILEIVNK